MQERRHSFYVSQATVRLEILDENNKTVSWASGFVVDEHDFLSLYTCWHVVTGVDPHNIPVRAPPKRNRIKVHTQTIRKISETLTGIGGLTMFDVDLYDQTGTPIWRQGASELDVDNATLPPPFWDCVRIDVEKSRNLFANVFKPCDEKFGGLTISDDAYIVGYPYGFSPNPIGPVPIFLRRTVASDGTSGPFILLDGSGVQGMSGGPVVTKIDGEWRLAGIYNGAIFPEATFYSSELEKRKWESRLPLGKYTMSMVARHSVGAT